MKKKKSFVSCSSETIHSQLFYIRREKKYSDSAIRVAMTNAFSFMNIYDHLAFVTTSETVTTYEQENRYKQETKKLLPVLQNDEAIRLKKKVAKNSYKVKYQVKKKYLLNLKKELKIIENEKESLILSADNIYKSEKWYLTTNPHNNLIIDIGTGTTDSTAFTVKELLRRDLENKI